MPDAPRKQVIPKGHVSTAGSLIGGGDLPVTLSLVGDTADTLYGKYYYGTDINGTKGWYPFPASGGGSSVWGGITGTLSDQTDLQSALDAKVPITRTVNSLALSSNITLSTASIADSTNKRYVTDANLVVIGNTSGVNTGDQSLAGLVPTSRTLTIAGTALDLSANRSWTLDTISGVSANGFLKRTGANTWTNDSSTYLTGNQTVTLSGDVTGSGSTSIAATIAAGAVTYAKMQNVSANSVLLGSSATGSGSPPSQIVLGTNLSMSGSTLNAAAAGSVTSIATTSPIAGGTITTTGTIGFDHTVDLVMTAAQTCTVSDTNTGAVTNILTLGHNHSSSSGGTAFGTGMKFLAEDSTTNDQFLGTINAQWSDATHASPKSYFTFLTAPSAGGQGMSITSAGGVAVGTPRTDTAFGVVNVDNGYKIGNNAAGTGKVLMGNGTIFVQSTPVFPTTQGSAGYSIQSNASSFSAYPMTLFNSSTSSQSPSTTDVYITGSNVVVAAGDFKAKGQYRCVFDIVKSAGTGGIVISVRTGTNGSTADTANLTFTFAAGTSVADTGTMEVIVNWRTVGSGTSAVVSGVCRAIKNTITAAGLWGDTSAAKTIVATVSSGFASNTFTNMGISFNGGTAFAGTITTVRATLMQP